MSNTSNQNQSHISNPSHTTSGTHPSSQLHSSSQGHTTTHSTVHSHKNTIQQFADAVNGNHLNNLEKYLDNNVEKTIDSQIIYKNLKEAHDYYAKEHLNNKTNQWKILNFHDEDQKGNTIQAKLTYDNETYNTKYTFSSSGKIQRIDANIHQNQTLTNIHQ